MWVVVPGGAAHASGLQKEKVIESIDGQRLQPSRGGLSSFRFASPRAELPEALRVARMTVLKTSSMVRASM